MGLSPCQLRNDYMQRYASKVSGWPCSWAVWSSGRWPPGHPGRLPAPPSSTGLSASFWTPPPRQGMCEPEGDKRWLTDGKASRCSPPGPGKRGASPLLVGVPCLPFTATVLASRLWLLASTCHPGDPVNVRLNTRQASGRYSNLWDSICVAHCCILLQ